MFELSRSSYHQVEPLIRASGMQGHRALVFEVLEGRLSGQVLCDRPDNPNTAFVCGSSGFFFAFGRPDEPLLREIIERFWRPTMDHNYTTLFGSTPAWNEPMQLTFAPVGAQRESRLAFELHTMPPAPQIPTGFSLQPITTQLARSILDGTGTGSYGIDPWFVRIAGGPEAYASQGLGLALVCEGQIASICGICGMGGGEVELEVGTVPAYRGMGLASMVSAAFMQQCQERGLIPAYTCSSQNHASVAVAHKLGYREVEEIHGYRLYEERMRAG